MATILEARKIEKKYTLGGQTVYAVAGIDMTVEEGDFISIMGPSGSGKTTLLNLLGCIDRPTAGRVLVAGRDTTEMNASDIDRIRLHNIGFVFQRINLIPILSAQENVELPMELAGVGAAQRHRRAGELLDTLGMSRRAHHRPGQLSAGEQQRIGIARSLANNPGVILADEPTGNLDSKTAALIMDCFKTLNRDRGQTLILVTHDPDVGASAARSIVIRDGRLDFETFS